MNRIGRITGVSPAVVQGDVRDRDLLKNAMIIYQCSAVIHFAGLKSVADSVAQPLEYYDNNVLGTLRLLQAMQDANIRKSVFVIGDRIWRTDYLAAQGGSSVVAV